MNIISAPATEKSTYEVTAVFYGEQGTAVTPDTLTWTLSDVHGNVINAREDVSVAAPAASNAILLQGDDLAVNGDAPTPRIITFEGTYTSAVHGAGLPLKLQALFTIMPITVV